MAETHDDAAPRRYMMEITTTRGREELLQEIALTLVAQYGMEVVLWGADDLADAARCARGEHRPTVTIDAQQWQMFCESCGVSLGSVQASQLATKPFLFRL
jgi:hypothetical protein